MVGFGGPDRCIVNPPTSLSVPAGSAGGRVLPSGFLLLMQHVSRGHQPRDTTPKKIKINTKIQISFAYKGFSPAVVHVFAQSFLLGRFWRPYVCLLDCLFAGLSKTDVTTKLDVSLGQDLDKGKRCSGCSIEIIWGLKSTILRFWILLWSHGRSRQYTDFCLSIEWVKFSVTSKGLVPQKNKQT